jgi:hypothetical protein
MKNFAFICLVAAVLLIAGLHWRSPTQQASIGPVNISFRDLPESNTNGAMFLLSNGGPYELECQVYSQVYVSGRWRESPEGRSMDFTTLPVLQPTTALRRCPSGRRSGRGFLGPFIRRHPITSACPLLSNSGPARIITRSCSMSSRTRPAMKHG